MKKKFGEGRRFVQQDGTALRTDHRRSWEFLKRCEAAICSRNAALQWRTRMNLEYMSREKVIGSYYFLNRTTAILRGSPSDSEGERARNVAGHEEKRSRTLPEEE